MQQTDITLALGGGGARGAAHLGVIEELEKAGFRIRRIVGTSIGSVIGSVFAWEADVDRVRTQVIQYLGSRKFQRTQSALLGSQGTQDADGGMFGWYSRVKSYLRANRAFHRVVTKPSMLPGVMMQGIFNSLVPAVNIEDTKIPLTIVALDLISGHQVLLESGPVRRAVQASSALPGIFPPVNYEGMQLCDIGAFNTLPSLVARSYKADTVVAVDVSSPLPRISPCETALDVLMRVDELGETMFRRHSRQYADVLIRPDVGTISWFDFSRTEDLIEAGRRAARAELRRIRRSAN